MEMKSNSELGSIQKKYSKYMIFLFVICDIPFSPLSRANNFALILLKTGQTFMNIQKNVFCST